MWCQKSGLRVKNTYPDWCVTTVPTKFCFKQVHLCFCLRSVSTRLRLTETNISPSNGAGPAYAQIS